MNIEDLQEKIILAKQKGIILNQTKRFQLIWTWLVVGTIALIITFGIWISQYIYGDIILPFLWNSWLIIPLGFIGMYSPFILLYWIWYYIKFIASFYEKIFDSIYEMNLRILKQASTINTINEILEICNNIYWLINKVKFYRYILYFLYGHDSIYYLNTILGIEMKWLNLVLTDLRSDVSIRLTEQQQSLESAKSEVEKNIQWTTELESVSGLQRARLDRQIEQFEELQRVLVKV